MTGRRGQEEGQMGIVTNRSVVMVDVAYYQTQVAELIGTFGGRSDGDVMI
jgi:hypothetical protein